MLIKTYFLLFFAIWGLFPICAQTKKLTFDPRREFVVGQSLSLSGHFKLYGSIIKNAIETAFQRINKQGGVKGKQLRLLAIDDGGNAEKTARNIKQMNDSGVRHFIGIMGTRGLMSLLPDIKEGKIGCYFPWGGNSATRNQAVKGIINGPGMLEPQLEALTKYITETHRISRVAIFHADDDFSSDAAKQLNDLLVQSYGKPAHLTSYNRFNFDLTKAVQSLISINPRLIVCVSTSTPCVRLINELFMHGVYGTMFCGIDSTFMVPHVLQSKGIQFKCSGIVPDPEQDKSLLVEQYKQDLALYCPDEKASTLSLTYYICARLLAEALERAENASVAAVVKYFEAIKEQSFLGFPLNFNPLNRHVFGEKVWIF